MEIQIEQLYGIWRNIDENGIITDFAILKYDELNNTRKSLFTIYKREERKESKVIYEWQGVPLIINHIDNISEIKISKIAFTKDNPIYQNLKIWSFTNKVMILEYANGQKVEFTKLNR